MRANWENDMDIQNLKELEAAIHAFDNDFMQFEPEQKGFSVNPAFVLLHKTLRRL